MPATASRPPPPTLSLLDDCPRSPPYPKPPASALPTPKPALSPRIEKKPPLSPSPEAEAKKFDKSDRRPDPLSDPGAESPPEQKADSRPVAKGNPAEDKKTDKELIEWETFNQILELDEDGTHEFSQQMVEDFYTQAEETFEEMNGLFKSKDLSTLSDKGHFLKGSSAAIGIKKVQKSCEEIQNYGKLLDAEGASISREEALKRLGVVLVRVRTEYDDVKAWLDDYFNKP